jgi:hypothetical protein
MGIQDGRSGRMQCHLRLFPAVARVSEPGQGTRRVLLGLRVGGVVRGVWLHVLALSVETQTERTERGTCEAHVGMLQEHTREGAESGRIARSSPVCLLDGTVWRGRYELRHWLEVATCSQFPLASQAAPSLTILAACRGAIDAGAGGGCRRGAVQSLGP